MLVLSYLINLSKCFVRKINITVQNISKVGYNGYIKYKYQLATYDSYTWFVQF